MSDNKSPLIMPRYVRPKLGRFLAGCGGTEFQERLNSGRYRSYIDGKARMVEVESIFEDQRRMAAENGGTPKDRPAQKAGPGRPKGSKKTQMTMLMGARKSSSSV